LNPVRTKGRRAFQTMLDGWEDGSANWSKTQRVQLSFLHPPMMRSWREPKVLIIQPMKCRSHANMADIFLEGKITQASLCHSFQDCTKF
jgi:hypothetical protein